MLKSTYQLLVWCFSANCVALLHCNSSKGPRQEAGHSLELSKSVLLQEHGGKPWCEGLDAMLKLADILADLQQTCVHENNQSFSFPYPLFFVIIPPE